jgi:hypothetical protein
MPLKDYNNFIEYVRGKSVAIVGPAQLDFTFGKEIDNHDIVVRINRYKEIKDEDKYGKKTNIFCFCFWEKIGNIPIDINNKPGWVLNTYNLKYIIDCTKSFHNNMILFKDVNFSEFPNYIYSDINYPTSGFCVLMNFLYLIEKNIISKLSIYGMSLNLTAYNNKYHSKSSPDNISIHNFYPEREYLKMYYNKLKTEIKKIIYIENECFKNFLEGKLENPKKFSKKIVFKNKKFI